MLAHFFVLVLLFTTSVFAAETYTLENSKSTVEFLAIGQPSSLRIKGKTLESKEKPLQGKLVVSGNSMTGTAKYALDALTTGIEMRDHHMKEKYLEVAKYPHAELTITKMEVPKFEGTLLLHGVKKPIDGTVDFSKKESDVEAKFEFKLKLKDYSVALPSFMGITMADDVSVTVKTEGKVTQ